MTHGSEGMPVPLDDGRSRVEADAGLAGHQRIRLETGIQLGIRNDQHPLVLRVCAQKLSSRSVSAIPSPFRDSNHWRSSATKETREIGRRWQRQFP